MADTLFDLAPPAPTQPTYAAGTLFDLAPTLAAAPATPSFAAEASAAIAGVIEDMTAAMATEPAART